MPLSWSARTTQTISAAAMSALLLVSARKHFQEPKLFSSVVPDYLCREDHVGEDQVCEDYVREDQVDKDQVGGDSEPRADERKDGEARRRNANLAVMSREEWIAVSGLLEAAAAVGLLIPATRTTAARGTALMFTAFLAGHVDALRRAYSPGGTAPERRIHALRLPLQLPLIVWAWSLARGNRSA